MKLKDNCPECVEVKPEKEYQKIPKSLCPDCVKPKEEIRKTPKRNIIKVTEYCLRDYMRKVVMLKNCQVTPKGC
jgi:hypothetical protein